MFTVLLVYNFMIAPSNLPPHGANLRRPWLFVGSKRGLTSLDPCAEKNQFIIGLFKISYEDVSESRRCLHRDEDKRTF
jgi:hypothetical protein